LQAHAVDPFHPLRIHDADNGTPEAQAEFPAGSRSGEISSRICPPPDDFGTLMKVDPESERASAVAPAVEMARRNCAERSAVTLLSQTVNRV